MQTTHGPQDGLFLLGDVVRERVSDLGWTMHLVAQRTGIPVGTLMNCTRPGTPQRMRKYRVRKLGRALRLPMSQIVDDGRGNGGQSGTNDGAPNEGQPQPQRPAGPAPRRDQRTGNGPKRAETKVPA